MSGELSVIVPACNNERTLSETLESISRQTYFKDAEIYIHDDCSADGTPRIIGAFARAHDNVRVLRSETRLGVMSSYRRLLQSVDSEYVAPIEGDDLWQVPERLEIAVEFMRRHDAYACFNAFLLKDEFSNKIRVPSQVNNRRYRVFDAYDLLRENTPASFSNCAYRTATLTRALAHFAGKPGFDWPVNVLIAGEYGLYFIPKILSTYRISISGAWSALSDGQKRQLTIETTQTMLDILPRQYREAVIAVQERTRNP